ncbi:MAG: electron transport complex subunit E [Christensenellaceae bacterium]|nr:electron transport complex subunit E [Christensenellaceae bacterium]
MDVQKALLNGVITENPTFRLVLGMCPTLAVTTAAGNGLAMGLATTAVLVGSNFLISLLRNFIPSKVRIPAYIVVIATLVTVVDLLMKAYLPALSSALGLYIPLIVVNCIIFARAESFASKNPPLESVLDGIGIGIGFTLALILLASVRELLGAGSIFGVNILGPDYPKALIFVMAPGGFFSLGLLLAAVNRFLDYLHRRTGGLI